MKTIGVCASWVVGGGPPCKLPIGSGMCKGSNNNPLLILAALLPLPMSFVDLGNGPDISEFEDLVDDFDT